MHLSNSCFLLPFSCSSFFLSFFCWLVLALHYQFWCSIFYSFLSVIMLIWSIFSIYFTNFLCCFSKQSQKFVLDFYLKFRDVLFELMKTFFSFWKSFLLISQSNLTLQSTILNWSTKKSETVNGFAFPTCRNGLIWMMHMWHNR